MNSKLIYTSYSPNSRNEDLDLNWKILFDPSSWYEGDYVDLIKSFFGKHYPKGEFFTFNYARSALYHLFSSIDHKEGDEVIYQGFTCAAASLPAIWAGYKPVYVDIDEDTLSATVESVEGAITDRTKFIVIQYTMGLAPNVKEIIRLAQSRGILIIEDCTHYLPSSKQNEIGSLGDFSIFSLGRDKVVSGVDGGVLLINNDDYKDLIRNNYKELHHPSKGWLIKQIMFPIIWSLVKSMYTTLKIGKAFHLFFSEIGLLTRATSPEEKRGEKPKYIPALLPNSLAQIAYKQLEDINQLQEHRTSIASIYSNHLANHPQFQLLNDFEYPPLRFPLKHNKRDQIIEKLNEENIMLGDWYSKPVSPPAISDEISCYIGHSCPTAEVVTNQIFNLPTHINISKDDAELIVSKLLELSNKLENDKS